MSAFDATGITCPTVYHIQRKAPVQGTLLVQDDCVVLEEQVVLDGCLPQTIYTPVYCLGTVGQWFLRTSPLIHRRALYVVQDGERLLVYTPYQIQRRCLGQPTLLPTYSTDREAMFRFARQERQQRNRLGGPAVLAPSSVEADDEDATLHMPALPSFSVSC